MRRLACVCLRVVPFLLVLAGCRAPAPTVEVVSLAEQLPGADLRVEPAVIDLGEPEARTHLVSGWSRDEKHSKSGQTFVWSLGERSVLTFHLGWTRDLTVVAECRPFHFRGAKPQHLMVGLNGHQVHEAELAWGTQTVELAMPARFLQVGDNTLTFEYAAAHAPTEVVPGSKDERRLAVAWSELRFQGSGLRRHEQDPARAGGGGVLTIPIGSRVDYFFDLPRGAKLRLGETGIVGTGSAVVHVGLLEDLGKETELAALKAPFDQTEVVLRNHGGPARLRIEVLPDAAESARAVRMIAATIVASRTNSALHEKPGAGERPGLPDALFDRPNVIVYLVDALRADRLGCYGSSKALSPRLDEFAREAVVFEDAVAQSSWTKAAVASLFTGRWPVEHGANGPDDALPPRLETLSEALKGGGYRTAAVSANAYVHKPFGFGRGFDHFVFIPEGDNDAVFVNNEAFRLIDRIASHPFFLYLHTIDPHAPYRPPSELRRLFAGGVADPSVGEVETVRGLVLGSVEPSPDLTRDLEALYDAEVAANDAAFGELIDFLKARDLYEDSIICFVADHGEAFGEHGSFTHGIDLYSEVVNIPLVLRLPGGALGGRRVSAPVQQTDIKATLLELVGVETPDVTAGEGLFRTTGRSDMALTYLDYWGQHGAAVVTADWKLILPLSRAFGSEIQLYDRRSDPGETRNLVRERPVIAGLLAAELRRRLASPAGVAPEVEVDAETRRDLEALGYVVSAK